MVAVTKGTVPIVPVAQRRAERSEGRQSEPSPLSWRFLTHQVFLNYILTKGFTNKSLNLGFIDPLNYGDGPRSCLFKNRSIQVLLFRIFNKRKGRGASINGHLGSGFLLVFIFSTGIILFLP